MIGKLYFIEFLLFFSICITKSEHRSKRFLTFPRTSPTRLQMIVGIGIPVDLEIESVTIGWVNKSEYFLPENASNFLSFLNDPFDLTTRPIDGFYVRKKREDDKPNDFVLEEPKPTENPAKIAENSAEGFDSETNEKFEKHTVETEVVECGTTDLDSDADEDEDDDVEDEDEEEDETLNGMSEADYWNQEDHALWLREVHPKQPKNLALARWGIYKSIELLAQR